MIPSVLEWFSLAFLEYETRLNVVVMFMCVCVYGGSGVLLEGVI